jgi:ATP-binding protein involved in chromosome partitioning
MIPVIVTSGKGGVGKSTVSANLAIALAQRGIRVGLLDADLMDPVQHLVFRADKEAIREYGKQLLPLTVNVNGRTIEFMGIGPFIPRGVGVALNYQKTADFIVTLLKFVRWTADYLIIDSPPSSVDVNVKLLHELEGIARAVLVGEPHVFALEDNLRMLDLLRLYRADVRAIVLNKVGLYDPNVTKEIEENYSKLGLRVVKIPWDPQLQIGFKPELFRELVEVVLA